ncbi:MAG: ABC transporter ATP-binding protein [Rhodospirillaceae bacterium]|jgi:lipoprotein-releasing system ATP-binding protein|nr:ABC transporter ATP-binding protein [Rhodospirillaceae bacterium]
MSEGGLSDALVLSDIQRTFHQAGNDLQVLRGAAVSIASGETVALVGPSGAGKSTLLHIAGLLERPDGGEVIVDGEACSDLSDDRRTALRRTAIGFIYQFHHLLPEFTALENVVVPQMIAGVSKSAARKRASELLGMVGLSEREGHRPAKLSGGEQQRVAIARALANSPKVLIADEPTGNLDQETAERVFELLMRLTRETGVSSLVATHNPDLAARMDRKLTLKNGLLVAG